MNKPKNISTKYNYLEVWAGSWFEINKEGENFRIKRYSEEGVLECSRVFSTKSNNFDINKKYEFTYISNCKQCKIIQDNKTFTFNTNDYEY